MVLIDGKETNVEGLEELNPEKIESISVIKDSTATRLYGKDGAHGVILVTTKRTDKADEAAIPVDPNAPAEFSVAGTVVDEEGRPKAGVSVIIPNTTHGTLTDADGRFSLKVAKGSSLWFTFVGYETVKIAATPVMTVRMKPAVIKLLPEMDVTTKTKTPVSGTPLGMGVTFHGKSEQKPLVIIDGKEAVGEDPLADFPAERIKSFTILKDESAIKEYGEKGKNGVVIVTSATKEEIEAKKKEKPYSTAWEMVESLKKTAPSVKKDIVILIDGKEATVEETKNLSAKNVHGMSLSNDEQKNVSVIKIKTRQ